MELETINRLYLELSQFATAKTRRELELEKALNHELAKGERNYEMEQLLTSARAICERQGKDTHWQRFSDCIARCGIGSVTPRVFKILPSDLEQNPEVCG